MCCDHKGVLGHSCTLDVWEPYRGMTINNPADHLTLLKHQMLYGWNYKHSSEK